VDLGGKRVALRDYLDDLLFPVPMQRMKVKALSGGERNRLLLARLFLSGANVLVLDEPTNDLDIVTLNLLERLLLEYTGSVLLVTHDRYFLDKVATSILAFEGGRVVRYPGNYETYSALRARPASAAPSAREVPAAEKPAARKARLSFQEKRELEGIEGAVEAAEARKAELEARLSDPSVYTLGAAVNDLQAELRQVGAEIERLYARWQELSDRAAN
jgi:ATP-binding cassette subfamily F protein uup